MCDTSAFHFAAAHACAACTTPNGARHRTKADEELRASSKISLLQLSSHHHIDEGLLAGSLAQPPQALLRYTVGPSVGSYAASIAHPAHALFTHNKRNRRPLTETPKTSYYYPLFYFLFFFAKKKDNRTTEREARTEIMCCLLHVTGKLCRVVGSQLAWAASRRPFVATHGHFAQSPSHFKSHVLNYDHQLLSHDQAIVHHCLATGCCCRRRSNQLLCQRLTE